MSRQDRFDEQPVVGTGGFEPPESESEQVPSPAEQPQRPRVERQFKRMVHFTDLDLPDWEFITRTVELLEPYKKADDEDTFTIHGNDLRGDYYVYDLSAFREEYEERGQQLLSNTIKAYGHDAHGFFMFTVYYSREYGRGHAEIAGGNEIVVNGLAARIEQLTKEASERRKTRKKARQAEAGSTHLAVSLDGPSTPWWNNTWLVTVVGGVIAALIVALVVWLVSSH